MLFGGMPQIRSRYLTGRWQHGRQVVVVRRSGRPWTENGPKPHRRRKRKNKEKKKNAMFSTHCYTVHVKRLDTKEL